MGGTPSRYDDLSKNVYLDAFSSEKIILPDDPFWTKFLSFNMRPPVTRNDQIELGSKLDTTCQQLLKNNLITGNFGSLLQVCLVTINDFLASVQAQSITSTWQTFNALFSVRCILKYLIETVGDDLLKHTEAVPNNHEQNGLPTMRLESFIEALIEILIDVPLYEFTYVIHLEAINCLLVLLSIKLFSDTPPDYHPIYRIVMLNDHTVHAPVVVCTLLRNFAQQEHAPPGLLTRETGGSIVFSIAAGLWNVITRGMSHSFKNVHVSSNGITEEEEKKRDIETPLASQSLLLLLILTNHCTTTHNPYRDALFTFTNVQSDSAKTFASFQFNLDKLYTTICQIPNSDEVTLLLYMLLHRNPHVKDYVIKRPDIQQLVIPILQILYHAPDNTSHHIYMSLIILLILSEDDTFNKRIHEIMLKGINWYTERCISEISLGGLLILVVIRTLQYNMLKMRDKYLHTNCLAALANMSTQFRSLHPYVSQRLLSLFETLAKKHARLEAKIHNQSNTNNLESTSTSSTAITITDVSKDSNSSSSSNLIQDLSVLEEVIKMVLEIINSCLTHCLAHNPNLLYTILYKKDIFQPFKTHSLFQDIIQNISIVIDYFSRKLEDKYQSDIGVDKVLNIIQDGITHWPEDNIKKLPELKFRYVEEEQPEEFFIPYVWNIASQCALLHWISLKNSEPTIVVYI